MTKQNIRLARDFAAFQQMRAERGDLFEKKDAGSVDLTKVAETLEGIGKTFEEYKSTNDKRLEEIEKKGASDPLITEKLERIDTDLNALREVKTELEKLAAEIERKKSAPQTDNRETPEALEHKTAFAEFLRDPADHGLAQKAKAAALAHARELGLEGKAVDTLTGGAGGHGVPEILSREVNERLRDVSDVRSRVKVVNAGSADYKELVDVLGQSFGWVGETDARPETGTSGLEEVAPSFGTIYAYPKASEESLQDIFFDVEAWVVNTAIDAFAEGEGAAVVGGNGTNKPTGFLNGAPSAVADKAGTRPFGTLQYLPSGAAGAINDPDKIFDMVYSLRKGYRRNGVWTMNSLTTGTVRKLKSSDDQYLWQEGLKLGEPATLAGYPVDCWEDMPDVAADSLPIAFGDWMKGYVLVVLAGLRMTRDEVTEPGYVKWYLRRRLGGKVLDDNAIKLLKVATT